MGATFKSVDLLEKLDGTLASWKSKPRKATPLRVRKSLAHHNAVAKKRSTLNAETPTKSRWVNRMLGPVGILFRQFSFAAHWVPRSHLLICRTEAGAEDKCVNVNVAPFAPFWHPSAPFGTLLRRNLRVVHGGAVGGAKKTIKRGTHVVPIFS